MNPAASNSTAPPPPIGERLADPEERHQPLPATVRLWLTLGGLLSLVASAAAGSGTIRGYDRFLSSGTTGWDGGLLEVAFALVLGGVVALVVHLGLCMCLVWSLVHDPNRRAGPLLAMILGPLVVAMFALSSI